MEPECDKSGTNHLGKLQAAGPWKLSAGTTIRLDSTVRTIYAIKCSERQSAPNQRERKNILSKRSHYLSFRDSGIGHEGTTERPVSDIDWNQTKYMGRRKNPQPKSSGQSRSRSKRATAWYQPLCTGRKGESGILRYPVTGRAAGTKCIIRRRTRTQPENGGGLSDKRHRQCCGRRRGKGRDSSNQATAYPVGK